MGNKLRRRANTEESRSNHRKKPPGRWPFWRIVYWFGIVFLLFLISVGMYFTLKSNFGECSSYDVRCD